MRNILLLGFLMLSQFLFSQSASQKADSLLRVAENSDDSTKLRIYNKVGFYYIFNEPKKAETLLKKGVREAQQKKIFFSEAELVNTYGIYKDVSGESDSAKYYFEKALKLSRDKKYGTITTMIVNNLGMFHWNKGHYQEALEYFFEALEMNKDNSTDKEDGTYLNNIGLIYQEMGQADKALEYHRKALKIRYKHNLESAIPASLNNIGINLVAKEQYNEAEQAYMEALEAAKNANEFGVYYSVLNGLGKLYLLQEKPEKAIPVLKEAIAGRNELNISRRANLSTISNLIKAYNQTGNLQEAKRYIETGNDFLIEFPDLKNAAVGFYSVASETYFRQNEPDKGSLYLEKALVSKDSIFSSENAEKIAGLETKFKIAEKERDLQETRANLAERELEVKQKNVLLFGSLGFAVILGLVGYLLYSQQKLRNRQLQKEGELKTALARIETQNRLQEQRLRISRDLHDNIGSQLTFIISSIDTLKFGLKGASEATSEKLSNISNFASHTIYELRDTIWAMNKNRITFEDLQARISNFIEKANASNEGIYFSFSIAESISKETEFTSVQGMNLYRIIQEAVNNALKYAEANSIAVTIDKTGSEYIITVTDNGHGFDIETVALGNGIFNMKKRAKDMHGALTLNTAGKGTSVVLTFPE